MKEIYSIKKLEQREKELEPEVIIDFIRHGTTKYKEMMDPNFRFDPAASDFKLDEKHLDLTEPGIKEIEEAADQLVEVIDQDNEVVIMITSPNIRAISSSLVFKDRIQNTGIRVLGHAERRSKKGTVKPAESIIKSKGIRQMSFRDEGKKQEWMPKDQEYRDKRQGGRTLPPDEIHQEVAEYIGKDMDYFFTENYEDLENRFNRFIRHMMNLKEYLSPETLQQLQGKKIRIVCFGHEELPIKLMKKSMAVKQTIKRGQILEIQPEKELKRNQETEAKIKLYPKGESAGQESDIKIKFSPQEKEK